MPISDVRDVTTTILPSGKRQRSPTMKIPFALLFLVAASKQVTAQGIDCVATCVDDVCTFTAKVNLFAGELGYFTFEECGDVASPTLGIELGKTYRFVQVRKARS